MDKKVVKSELNKLGIKTYKDAENQVFVRRQDVVAALKAFDLKEKKAGKTVKAGKKAKVRKK